MKGVKAILRRVKVAEVVTALAELEDRPGVTVSEVQGFGRSRAQGAADAREGEDMDGEETEEDVKARLEAVDRARADEDKWMKDLEQRTGGDKSE